MIAFYLDYQLSEDELVEVQLAVGQPIEAVRIPWLLPVDRPTDRPRVEPDLLRPHLQRAGIQRCRDGRVALVAPLEISWYLNLCEAIHRETGHYPLLVQTPEHRDRAGCPGSLRIIDMEAYMAGEDTATRPPWLEDDGLFPDLG